MDKLQYDNLYKFLVSLGIVLIILPVAGLVYLFNMEPVLISQVDYDLLSDFSLQMINNRSDLTSYFFVIFPWLSGSLILMGVTLLFCGITKWVRVQKNLDKKLDAETAMQTLSMLKMSNNEVTAKIDEEASETTVTEASSEANSSTGNAHLNMMKKYVEIEELCYIYFAKKYARKYAFERNIRMGKFCYDFIGVSQIDNIDLVIEIKYFRVASGNAGRLYDTFERVYASGINYETIAHRNFRCIVVVVTPKEQLPRLEAIIETFCKAHRENASKMEIKCIAEEAL